MRAQWVRHKQLLEVTGSHISAVEMRMTTIPHGRKSYFCKCILNLYRFSKKCKLPILLYCVVIEITSFLDTKGQCLKENVGGNSRERNIPVFLCCI